MEQTGQFEEKKKEEIIAKCRNIDSLSAASGLSHLSTQDTRI